MPPPETDTDLDTRVSAADLHDAWPVLDPPSRIEGFRYLTSSDAEAFFSAYAESDIKVSAVTAPGSTIRSLNGVVRLDKLKDWQVFTGNDAFR